MNRHRIRLVVVTALLVLAALGEERPLLSQALSGTGFTLISEVRLSPTVSEFTYKATLFNSGGITKGAAATVTSVSKNTAIVDGSLTFGPVAVGKSTVSYDTFSFRHDRTTPSPWRNLRWQITPVSYVPGEGIVLPGAPGGRAVNALVRKDPPGASGNDIFNGVILTRIDMAVRGDATVGEVNAALEVVGGGIVSMLPGLPLVVVSVPRQPDAAALEALAAVLGAQPGVRFAMAGHALSPHLSPGGDAATAANLGHLYPPRFPAAWNVKSLADCSKKVTVVVPDFYRVPLDPSYDQFPFEVPGVQPAAPTDPQLEWTDDGGGSHGYDVLTTLAATLDADQPTGANPFPECLHIVPVQAADVTVIEMLVRVTEALPATGNFVLSSSLGFDGTCGDPCDAATLNVSSAFERAWAGASARALFRPYQDRLLVAQSAGNSGDDIAGFLYPGAQLAQYNGPLAIAATSDPRMSWAADTALWAPDADCVGDLECFPDAALDLTISAAERVQLDGYLADLDELDGTPLQNVLIVGNIERLSRTPDPSSSLGPDVFAVGTAIPTLDGGVTQGTSFSAPQVAGLAAFLLMVQPERHDAAGVVVDAYATVLGNLNTIDAPDMIDAYASVLALDPAGAPDPATWKVRQRLLDVNRDGHFTQDDVQLFLAHYFQGPNLETPVVPAACDDSEFDLNGDCFTGGEPNAAPFDLGRAGSTQHGGSLLGLVTIDVGGSHVELDETQANDLEILCYYAYSDLYEGDLAAREGLLVGRCGASITVAIDPGGATVGFGEAASFVADVTGTTDPRVVWSLPDGGGTISDAGVFTAGNDEGTFHVRATSVVDSQRFAEITVNVEDEDSIPPGTYAGTVVQRFREHDDITGSFGEKKLTWNLRLTQLGESFPPEVSGTAVYESEALLRGRLFNDTPICTIFHEKRNGTLQVDYYSGSSPNAVLGGYFWASGTVDYNWDDDCLEMPRQEHGTLAVSFTTERFQNYLPRTLPTLVRDATGKVIALEFAFVYDLDGKSESITGRLNLKE